jgi:hypothetical protein
MKDDENNLLTLEEQLGRDDWAIIIGSDGNLKGIFIPDGKDEELVPESIVQIMAQYFGVDFDEEMKDEESSDGQTIH